MSEIIAAPLATNDRGYDTNWVISVDKWDSYRSIGYQSLDFTSLEDATIIADGITIEEGERDPYKNEVILADSDPSAVKIDFLFSHPTTVNEYRIYPSSGSFLLAGAGGLDGTGHASAEGDAAQSSMYNNWDYPAEKAFNNTITNANDAWISKSKDRLYKY